MDFDYDRFYWLCEGFTRSAIRVHAVDEIPDPDALTRAEVTPKEPIRFRFDEGTLLYDFIGTTWAVLDIVSDRVIDALTENGFTGWTTYPVDIRSREDDPIHGYYGLAVTGRSGPIEDERPRGRHLRSSPKRSRRRSSRPRSRTSALRGSLE